MQKKTTKRFLTSMLIFTLVSSMFAISPQKANFNLLNLFYAETITANAEVEWKEAYIKYLLEQHESDSDTRFFMAYIDDDNIPELITASGEAHMDISRIFTYFNGDVVNLCGGDRGWSGYGSCSYREKQNQLIAGREYDNQIFKYICSIVNGQLKSIITFCEDDDATGKRVYKVNDIEVTELEYKKQLSTYWLDEDGLEENPITSVCYSGSPHEGILEMHEINVANLDAYIYELPYSTGEYYTGHGKYTLADTYGFENYSPRISGGILMEVLGPSFGLTAKEMIFGLQTYGVCRGFVSTVIATNSYSAPSVDGYGAKELFNVSKSKLNTESLLTADELIKRGQISSYFPAVQDELSGQHMNDLQGIYQAVKDFCENKNNGVMIHLAESRKLGHELLALGIESENDIHTMIHVYDCNDPLEHKTFGGNYLELMKDSNGNYNGWKYNFKYLKPNIVWGNDNPNGFISYCVDNAAYFYTDSYSLEDWKLLSVQVDTDINCTINEKFCKLSENIDSVVPIVNANLCCDEDGNIITPNYDYDMYWIDTNKPITLSGVSKESEIILCDDESRIVVNLPTDAKLDILVDDNGQSYTNITTEDKQTVSVSYETVDKSEKKFIPVTVTATGTLETALQDNVLVVSGSNILISDSTEVEQNLTSGSYAIVLSEDLSAIESATKVSCYPDLELEYKYLSDGTIEITKFISSTLMDIALPSTINGVRVTSIGKEAFYECENLTSVIIPESMISIGDSAFSNCMNLKEITIPESVTSIGNSAFYCCSSLRKIRILNCNCKIYDSTTTISKTATIYGHMYSTAETYAKKFYKDFSSFNMSIEIKFLSGDLSGDGKISVFDAVLLQRYLHGKENFTRFTWENADINHDGVVNIYDLILLKRMILKN